MKDRGKPSEVIGRIGTSGYLIRSSSSGTVKTAASQEGSKAAALSAKVARKKP